MRISDKRKNENLRKNYKPFWKEMKWEEKGGLSAKQG